MQIVIFNIPVEVIRKNIKNLHLSVLPPDGRVRVSAPTQLTDEAITMFVRTKLSWIKKQQEKFQQQPRQSERQYVSGETLYVWGKQYFLQVEYSYKGNALTLSGDKARRQQQSALPYSFQVRGGTEYALPHHRRPLPRRSHSHAGAASLRRG